MNGKKDTQYLETALAEELATEAVWFGFAQEVIVATRREAPISRVPSIVTVITAEEIKNLGYRTFVEVLRTVPGFEIAKGGIFGTTLPNARGLDFAGQIRLMIDGHLVNNPFRGDAFINFDNFPVENIPGIGQMKGKLVTIYPLTPCSICLLLERNSSKPWRCRERCSTCSTKTIVILALFQYRMICQDREGHTLSG